MNEQQLEMYLCALDDCAKQMPRDTDPGLMDRLEEMKWILQRIYKQPEPMNISPNDGTD